MDSAQALEQLRAEAASSIEQARSPDELEQLRVKFLGRKSRLTEVMKSIPRLAPDQRAAVGKSANELKRSIELQLAARGDALSMAIAGPTVDVTLPGSATPHGHLHPITQTIHAILSAFLPMGFEIIEGPELELEYYNFDALNIPRDHPSRESFDTFFVDLPSTEPGYPAGGGVGEGSAETRSVRPTEPGYHASGGVGEGSAERRSRRPPEPKKGRLLLRSHTSPVQIRVMERRQPPLRIVVPGKVFRPDPLDPSHSFMFHQIEGLMVDDRTSFADLKGVLEHVLKALFGAQTKTRFRPHYFPFTEPSAEVDIACASCGGRGCSTCGKKGWLEIMGCGMVHPNVFHAVGYDPRRVQGFAFGMGVERIAMLQHGITDIRLFFENDLRFLEQF